MKIDVSFNSERNETVIAALKNSHGDRCIRVDAYRSKVRISRIYPQFCVNVKGWCKIKVDRGGVQGSLFAALIAMKQKSCSLSRAAAQPLFIYP